MSLDDELEKIRQAEEWLRTEPTDSKYYVAAKDHLLSIVEWSRDDRVVAAARMAINRWVNKLYADL